MDYLEILKEFWKLDHDEIDKSIKTSDEIIKYSQLQSLTFSNAITYVYIDSRLQLSTISLERLFLNMLKNPLYYIGIMEDTEEVEYHKVAISKDIYECIKVIANMYNVHVQRIIDNTVKRI